MKTTRYVYQLTHKPSGKVYIGCRYARGCHPDDLFKTYFTSSKAVNKLIKKDGVESFETLILWVGGSSKEVLFIESEQILEAKEKYGSVMLLNRWGFDYRKSNCSSPFGHYIMTEEARKNASIISKNHYSKLSRREKIERTAHLRNNPDVVAKRCKSIHKTLSSKEAREANSRRTKEYYDANPEVAIRLKKRAQETMTNVPKTEDHRKAISEGQKRLRQAQGAIWRSNRAQDTKNVWRLAQAFWELSQYNPDNTGKYWGHEKFCSKFNGGDNVRIFWRMREEFKNGWIPKEDPMWLEDFKEQN